MGEEEEVDWRRGTGGLINLNKGEMEMRNNQEEKLLSRNVFDAIHSKFIIKCY